MITPVNSIDAGYIPNMVGSAVAVQNKGNANQSPVNTVNSASSSSANYSNSGKADSQTGSIQTKEPSEATVSPDNSSEQEKLEQVQQVVDQLKARDREVRAHEQAHLAAAGGYANGMSFSYQTGPDGKKYAVGGEVGIDTSKVSGDPQATIQKAMVIQQAAMAPAEPSSQDYKVARQAAAMMAEARAELAAQGSNESSQQGENVNEGEVDSVTNNRPEQIVARDSGGESAAIESADRQQFNLRMQMPIEPLLAS